MTYSILPSFWRFPSRWPNWDDEEDMGLATSSPSGLSISEDDTHVYVEASIPGVDSKNVDVTFDKGVLWIKAETKEEEEDKKKKYYRKATRAFSYRVAVPGDVNYEKDPKAVCKNGVMTVTFNKSPKTQPKKITVKNEE